MRRGRRPATTGTTGSASTVGGKARCPAQSAAEASISADKCASSTSTTSAASSGGDSTIFMSTIMRNY
jgi:hypothetical protein